MNSNWQYKIQQHEATPPQGAWKNIAIMLDEEENKTAGFANRIIAFETAPPAITQKNIFALLDAAEHQQFENRLYNYETAAPETVWPQIAAELNKDEAKIIPLEPRTRNIRRNFLKVAAAVIVVALLSITAWVLNNKPATEGSELVVNTKQPAITAGTPKVNTPINNNPSTITQQTQNANAVTTTAVSKANSESAVNNLPGPAYIGNTDVITLAQNPATARAEKLQNSNGETPQDIALLNNSTANTYITITGPDGQAVKVSSKLAALVSYLTDNPDTQENIEIIIKESAKWRATFATWREKMTNNSIAPSLTNFMDIIELSNVLEEKK